MATATCQICGKEIVFIQRPSQMTRKCCSKECSNENLRRMADSRRRKRTRTCPICGVVFVGRAKGIFPQTYCSKPCSRKGIRAKYNLNEKYF